MSFVFLSSLVVLVLIPLDRGKLLGFVGKRFPSWFSLVMVSWNIGQVFLFILSPFLFFIPSGDPVLKFIPFGLVLLVAITVFRSALRVVENKFTLKIPDLPKKNV